MERPRPPGGVACISYPVAFGLPGVRSKLTKPECRGIPEACKLATVWTEQEGVLRMTFKDRVVRVGLAAVLVAAVALTGCAPEEPAAEDQPTGEVAPAAEPVAIKIGTLAIGDSLPLWVAEQKGY